MGRGGHRGYRPTPIRGRGQGRGRGYGRGRGRGGRGGRGGGPQDAFPPGPVETHGHLEDDLVFNGNVEDFTLDYTMPPSYHGAASPIRRYSGHQTPRGAQAGRGRYGRVLRGLGFSPGHSPGPRIPLSTLERERPLLRPVEFVRGIHQKTLFEEVEEILHAPGEKGEALEENVPSADIVEKIFQHGGPTDDLPPSSDTDSTSDSGDNADTKVAEDNAPAFVIDAGPSPVAVTSEPSESIVDNSVIVGAASQDRVVVGGIESTQSSHSDVQPTVAKADTPAFVIDTTPGPVAFTSNPSESFVDSSIIGVAPLGEEGDDDVIVYEAPNPRLKEVNATAPSHPTSASESNVPPVTQDSPTQGAFPSQGSGSKSIDSVSVTSVASQAKLAKQVQTISLKPTPRSRKKAKKGRAVARREARRARFNMTGGMTSVGLSMEERAALQEGSTVSVDPRYAERRQGDSDVDWGSDGVDEIEEVVSGVGDMDLDGEIGDIAALTHFVQGAKGLAGEAVVTITDLEDGARIREEDETNSDEEASSIEEASSEEETSSEEEEDVFDAEERKAIGEVYSASSSDEEDEDTPRRSFQGRLQRLRAKAAMRPTADGNFSSNEEEGSDVEVNFKPGVSWADRDQQVLDAIEDMLDENEHLLRRGADRKARKGLFKAIRNGDLEDDYDALIPSNMRKRDRQIPLELRDQWERDRAKKAERKRLRELARMQGAAGVSSMSKSARGKQQVLGGARFQGDTIVAERVEDMIVLEELIRALLDHLEMKHLVLPPKSKVWRKRAHLLAEAFNLKSKSKGKGDGRYMTLMKTTRSGVGVNERKISLLVNGNYGERAHAPARAARVIRHRDGDEVGKMAPRLSESNIGFKLLQQMGWEEGDRIGVSGGLADPLTAIIKTTKLGLGATR